MTSDASMAANWRCIRSPLICYPVSERKAVTESSPVCDSVNKCRAPGDEDLPAPGRLPSTIAKRSRLFFAIFRGASGHGVSGQPVADHLQEPAERFETEQQATSHLVCSQRPDHMLVRCRAGSD